MTELSDDTSAPSRPETPMPPLEPNIDSPRQGQMDTIDVKDIATDNAGRFYVVIRGRQVGICTTR